MHKILSILPPSKERNPFRQRQPVEGFSLNKDKNGGLYPHKHKNMACTTDFIQELCDILSPLGEVRSRKMMGDYVIYVNEKCVITACDNITFIKKLPYIAEMMSDAETGTPYPGAKEAYILDTSNHTKALEVIATLWEKLPFPRKRK